MGSGPGYRQIYDHCQIITYRIIKLKGIGDREVKSYIRGLWVPLEGESNGIRT